jgi:hypothetical protein
MITNNAEYLVLFLFITNPQQDAAFPHSKGEIKMQIKTAFTYVFQDPEWLKKIGIVGLVNLIPLVGQIILLGWAFDIIKRVIADEPTPLPGLKFKEHLTVGFKGTVGLVSYLIPFFVLAGVAAAIPAAALLATDTVGTGLIILSVLLGGLALVYFLVILLVMQCVFCSVALDNTIAAAYRLGKHLKLVRAVPGAFVFSILFTGVALAIGGLGAIVFLVGALFTMTYGFAVKGHLFAQAYQRGLAAIGEAP